MKENTLDILIEVMEDVIEDLHGHVHRVSNLAVDLGTGIGPPEEDLDRLAIRAPRRGKPTTNRNRS